MTTKLITQKATPNPSQLLLHTLEKFIKWHHPGLKFYIAGGAVLKAYNSEPITTSDLDVFVGSHGDFVALHKTFEQASMSSSQHVNCHMYKFGFFEDSPFTKKQCQEAEVIGRIDGNFKPRDHVPVQIVTNKWYESFEDLLELFDFNICQMGYTNGEYIMTQTAFDDNMSKTLRFSEEADMARFKHRRLLKYCKRGYTPDMDVFKQIFLDAPNLYIGDLSTNDDFDDYDL
jgi:hypothetical protein